MDITKELSELKDNSYESIVSLRKELEKEQEDLKKKVYIFKVLELGVGLEAIVNSGLTQQDGIYGINVRYSSSNLVGSFPLLSYHVVNEKNQQIDDNLYYQRKTQALSEINTLFSQHIDKGFKITDRSYVDKDFKSDEWFYLDCSKGIKDQVINLFLNANLKKVANYSKIQMDLPVNNTNQSKRVKM